MFKGSLRALGKLLNLLKRHKEKSLLLLWKKVYENVIFGRTITIFFHKNDKVEMN